MRLWGEEGVWVRRECGCGGRGALGVWLGVRREGVAGAHRGCGWGSPGVRMSAPGSFWGLDGTEVLCFRRREEVWAGVDDRAKGFRCDT